VKALTWQGKRDVRVSEVPDPILQEPTDAIVRVTSTAICGSDLHLYEVMAPFLEKGDVLGHEAMGIVEEVGKEVPQLRPGDRVVVPFNIACGSCYMCKQQLYAQCETTQVREHGKGAALFGYTSLYGAVPGGQAEFVRVPMAHFGPIPVPAWGPDERWLYLSDILPTAWQAVRFADVRPGSTVAVLGLGPVGQLATRVALETGAGRVVGIDPVLSRVETARMHGVEGIDSTEIDDLTQALLDTFDGRGPDAVIDAVGLEATGGPGDKLAQTAVGLLPDVLARPLTQRLGVDRLDALHTAVKAVRRGGAVSVVGVYAGQLDPMPMMEMFDRGVQLRMGQAHVRRWVDEILPLLTGPDDPLGVEDLATHRLPLSEAPLGYEIFQGKRDGCLKVVLQP
jgi:threonine dehydrogenase-like Zn-dependent dehydrogenase